ncbi:MAG: MbtH family NRPS accessory protein [Polyangiales bacterium]
MSWDSENGTFKVVINHEEQYALWPDYLAAPAGWTEVGMRGAKEACLAYVETHWTDMRPRSLRIAQDGTGT